LNIYYISLGPDGNENPSAIVQLERMGKCILNILSQRQSRCPLDLLLSQHHLRDKKTFLREEVDEGFPAPAKPRIPPVILPSIIQITR
jgi:hypothetical protein